MSTPSPFCYYDFASGNVNGTTVTNIGTSTGFTGTLASSGLCRPSDYRYTNQQLILNAQANQYMTIPSFLNTTANGMTISFWFRNNGTVSGYGRLIDFYNTSTTDNIILHFSAITSAATQIGLYVVMCPGFKYYYIPGNYSDNVWRHIAWILPPGTSTTDGSVSGSHTVYINGYPATTFTGIAPIVTTRTTNYIGKSAYAADASFNGAFAEFQMYNSQLTSANVNTLYKSKSSIFANYNDGSNNQMRATALSTNLICRYTFNSEDVTINDYFYDSFSYNGTATSAYKLVGTNNYSSINTDVSSNTFANINSAAYVTGNGALVLEGSNYGKYVTINPITFTSKGTTFSCWFRSNGNISWARIFDFGNGSNNNNVFMSVSSGSSINSLNCLCIAIFNGSNYVTSEYSIGINVNDNVWRHVTWTISTNLINKIYINGQLINKLTLAYYPSASPLTLNYIGKSNTSGDPAFCGAIDDFRIYNAELTSDQVAQIAIINPLYFWYTFESNTVNGTSLANMATGTASYDALLSTTGLIVTNDSKTGSASLLLNNNIQFYPPGPMTGSSTTLTGYSYGSGTYAVSASSVTAGSEAYKAFTNIDVKISSPPYIYIGESQYIISVWTDKGSEWNSTGYKGSDNTTMSGTTYNGCWIQLTLPTAIILTSYSITCNPTDPFPRCPSAFTVGGSNDGSTWTTLDSPYNLIWPTNTTNTKYFTSFSVSSPNPVAYLYFRIIFTSLVNPVNGYLTIYNISFNNTQSSQYVTLPSFWPGNNGLTFACWFKANCSSYCRILDFGVGYNMNNSIIIYIDASTGKLTINTNFPNSTNTRSGWAMNSTCIVNDNTWRHMVLTINTNGIYNLYLNGQLNATMALIYPNNVQYTNCYLGKSNDSVTGFNGGIDDFRMYKSTFTDAQVLSLYTGSTLAMHYTFDQNTVQGSSVGCLINQSAQLSTNIVTPNSTNATSNSWTNNGINWTSSASSNSTGNDSFYAFNNTINMVSSSCWSTSTASYTAGAAGTTYPTSSIYGEWIQIQSNVPVQMLSYSLTGMPQNQHKMPGTYYIFGSNDGITWYNIHYATRSGSNTNYTPILSSGVPDCSFGTQQIASTSTLIISTLSSTTNTQKIRNDIIGGTNNNNGDINSFSTFTTTMTGYSGAANTYTYFRMVVNAISNNRAGISSCNLSQWNITFNAPTITMPIYAGIISPNTQTCINNTCVWQNYGINWTATASACPYYYSGQNGQYPASYMCYYAFDNSFPADPSACWVSSQNLLYGSNGAANSSADSFTYANASGSVKGEWLQIQSNVPIQMLNYSIVQRYNFALTMPSAYSILGSNDGSSWNIIHSASCNVTANTNPSYSTAIYSISNIPGSYTDYNNGFTTNMIGYAAASSYYTYFKLVITNLNTNATSGKDCGISEWTIQAQTGILSTTNLQKGSSSLYLQSAYYQFVDLPNYQFGNNGITIALWFNIPSNQPNASLLFEFGNASSISPNTVINNNVVLYFYNNNLYFGVWNGNMGAIQTSSTVGSTTGLDASIITGVTTATWYHIAITIAINGTWQFFVNGQLTNTISGVYPFDLLRQNNYLGKSSNYAYPYYNGYIDDFRVYQSVISPNNIYNIYSNKSSVSKAQLTNYQNNGNDLSTLYKQTYSYQPGTIITIGGNGTSGYSGDNGLAIYAQLNGSYHVALDKQNNVFISDTGNNCIRRIDAVTNIITTICGTGIADLSGDTGAASSSVINTPMCIAFDSNGHLYIADFGNNRIRKITANAGIITGSCIINTICGNGTASSTGDGASASSATINGPTALAIDINNNIYIGEDVGSRIRKIIANAGSITGSCIISTIIGTGTNNSNTQTGYSGISTQVNRPLGMTTDSTGNLYYSDLGSDTVRFYNATTQIVTIIAGSYSTSNGSTTTTGDGGLAIYATLRGPTGLVLDAFNNLYIFQNYNFSIRMVSATTGIITTIAGNSTTPGYSGDGGLAINALLSNQGPIGGALDSSGNILFVDRSNNVIRKIIRNSPTNVTSTGFNINGINMNNYTFSPKQTTIPIGQNAIVPFTTNGSSITNIEPTIQQIIPIPGQTFTSNTLNVSGYIYNANASSAYNSTNNTAFNAFNGNNVTYWRDSTGLYDSSAGFYKGITTYTNFTNLLGTTNTTPITSFTLSMPAPVNNTYNLFYNSNFAISKDNTRMVFIAVSSTVLPASGTPYNTTNSITNAYYSTYNGTIWAPPTILTNYLTYTGAEQGACSIAMSADGTRIVFANTSNAGLSTSLYYTNWPVGNTPTTSFTSIASAGVILPTQVTMSADGNMLVVGMYSNSNPGVCYFKWSVSNAKYIFVSSTLESDILAITGICVSSNGSRLAYCADCNSTSTGETGLVYYITWNNNVSNYTNSSRIDSVVRGYRTVSFSSDGNILFASIYGPYPQSGTAVNVNTSSIYISYYNETTSWFNPFVQYVDNTVAPNLWGGNISGNVSRVSIFASYDGLTLYANSPVMTYSASTTTITIYKLSLTTIYGEWLQIQLPNPLQLTNYSFMTPTQYSNSVTAYNEPSMWYVVGSNDGSNWNYVDYGASTNALISTSMSTLNVSQIATTSNVLSYSTLGSTLRQYTTSTTTAYSYYRLVINAISPNFGYNYAKICQWNLNGIYQNSIVPVISNYGNIEQLVPVPGQSMTSNTLNYNGKSYTATASSYNTNEFNKPYNAFINIPNNLGIITNGSTWCALYNSYSNGIYTPTNYTTTFFGGEQNAVSAPLLTFASPSTSTTTGISVNSNIAYNGAIAFSGDGTKMVMTAHTNASNGPNTGYIYFNTCTNGAWGTSPTKTLQTAYNYGLISACLTYDGNRCIVVTNANNSSPFCMFCTWNGTNYSALISTNITTQDFKYVCSTNDGSRIVLAYKNGIAFSIWNGSTYNVQIPTGESTITNCQYNGLGMSNDGSIIAYSDSINNLVCIATWNGTNYTNRIQQITVGLTPHGLVFNKNVLYFNTAGGSTSGGGIYTSFYNTVTQTYGNFTQLSGNLKPYLSTDGIAFNITHNMLCWASSTGPIVCLSTVIYNAPGEWLQMQLSTPAKLTSYGIFVLTKYYFPQSFVMLGSNDNINWYMLDAQSLTLPTPIMTLITFNTTTTFASNYYTYFRLVVMSVTQSPGNTCTITNLVLNGIYL